MNLNNLLITVSACEFIQRQGVVLVLQHECDMASESLLYMLRSSSDVIGQLICIRCCVIGHLSVSVLIGALRI